MFCLVRWGFYYFKNLWHSLWEQEYPRRSWRKKCILHYLVWADQPLDHIFILFFSPHLTVAQTAALVFVARFLYNPIHLLCIQSFVQLNNSHSTFFPLDSFSQIYSYAMKLCILFLSSMKWRSEHEQCMQWYEEQFTHIFVLHAHISRRYAWWSPYCLRHNDSCRKLSKRSFEGSFVLITNHGVLLRIFAWSATIQTILYIWKDIWYAQATFKSQ